MKSNRFPRFGNHARDRFRNRFMRWLKITIGLPLTQSELVAAAKQAPASNRLQLPTLVVCEEPSSKFP